MNNEVLCMQPKYKRVLLKLSGESLAGEAKHGIDFCTLLINTLYLGIFILLFWKYGT